LTQYDSSVLMSLFSTLDANGPLLMLLRDLPPFFGMVMSSQATRHNIFSSSCSYFQFLKKWNYKSRHQIPVHEVHSQCLLTSPKGAIIYANAVLMMRHPGVRYKRLQVTLNGLWRTCLVWRVPYIWPNVYIISQAASEHYLELWSDCLLGVYCMTVSKMFDPHLSAYASGECLSAILTFVATYFTSSHRHSP
jgi:hypothetical protein